MPLLFFVHQLLLSFSCMVCARHTLVWLIPVPQVQNYMPCQDIDAVAVFSSSFFFVFGLGDDDGLLITMLSTTFVTSLMSWVLAEEVTADSGRPFLSARMCLFVPSLLLSVGLFPVIAPPRATLWICYPWIAMSSWYLLHHHRILTI